MCSESLNILFVFWRCPVNNKHVLEVVTTTPMTGQDAIKSIDLDIKKRFQKKLKNVKNLAGIKKRLKQMKNIGHSLFNFLLKA